MKKSGGSFLLTMWWFIVLAMIGCLVFLFTPNRERVSTEENRMLQKRPVLTVRKIFNGEYTSEFDNFMSDSIPARKKLIGLSNGLVGSLSFNSAEDMYYLDNTAKEVAAYQGEGTNAGGSEGDKTSDVSKDGEQEGAFEGDATLELIKHNNKVKVVYRYPRKNLEKVAENLELYADLIPEDGNVLITLVPFPGLARRFANCPDVYKGWRTDKMDILNELTSDKVKCIDTLRVLEPHLLNGENLFLYGNHQWNVHGAYYLFCEMIESLGLSATPYNEYQYKVNRPMDPELRKLDTYEFLYPLAPAKNYKVSNIDHKTEIPIMKYNAPTTGSYLYGHVRPWKTVVTGFHTGRKALIIGDCFHLPLSQFLLPYYDELHTTDIRLSIFEREGLGTTVADMMQRNKIDDVYVIFSEANDINSDTLLYALAENLY